ncbi:MAG: isochorismate synthase [Glaciecola sp.]|jgi:isochorismate synthase
MSFILSLINHHKKGNSGFAIYRWPNESDLHYHAGIHNNDAEAGFPFVTFDPASDKSLFLQEDRKLTGQSLTELFNQLNIVESSDLPLGATSELDTSKQTYIDGFNTIQTDIKEGVIQKAILSRKKTASFDLLKLDDLFTKTLSSHPSAMVYCFYHPTSGLWIGASPELIVRQQGKQFKTTSLAGTKSAEETAWGQKELDEQKIVTNFIINNLNSINSKYTLGDLKTVKAGNIYHLKQLIEFELTQGKLLDVVNRLHPTPAIGGHPKKAAYSTIKKAEQHDREYYCGYLGEVNSENSRLYVNLRCIKVYDNQIQIFVGGGITTDSQLEDEWTECERKSEGFTSLL